MKKTTYAYSIKTSRVKEPDFPYDGKQFQRAEDSVDFVKDLQSSDVEKFIVLYLDSQNKLICLQVTRGIVNQAVVYPREVLRHALLVNASAMILIHNHPSGSVRPSDADIRLTETIIKVAKSLELLVHDHIIIGGDSGTFHSMRESGTICF